MLTFEAPVWETFVRATAVYLILALTFRVLPKRHAGSVSPNDIIALVIIGGLMADAIAVGADSTPDLLVMAGTVLLWDHVFNLLEFHFPRFRRIAQDSPTLLIHNGRLLRHNLGRELITEEELASYLRRAGILEIGRVKQAVLEADGQISIVKTEDGAAG